MSIANEVQRLQTAKEAIKSAIESKGVTVGNGTIDTYAAKINEISGGGGGTGPSGYWERYIEVGLQIGPSDYDWPTEPNILTDIHSLSENSSYTMPDGRVVYQINYGSSHLITLAYREVYQG